MGMILGKVSEETPAHKVIHEASGYSIWQYPSSIAATVQFSSLSPPPETTRQFQSQAFRLLAGYIGVLSAPQNKPSEASSAAIPGEKIAMTAPVVMTPAEGEKIAMTAPVVMTPAEGEKIAMTAPVGLQEAERFQGEGRTMTFLLPSKYDTLQSAPTPLNQAVKLSVVPEGRVEAVLTFSGNVDMESGKALAKDLMAMLEKDSIQIVGDWSLYAYNAPFVLPWLKRNEIHIPVVFEEVEEQGGGGGAEW